MREETKVKIETVKKLLKQNYSLRKALREAKLGWKTYYKYENYVLADKNVPRPRRVTIVNVGGPYRIEKSMLDILKGIAKHTSKKILAKKYGTVRAVKEHRTEFKQLIGRLVNRWLYELLVESGEK
ncbi:MAG: hypothetical protein ACTSUS_07005 [Candidatus Freyarchaeota archaeon]